MQTERDFWLIKNRQIKTVFCQQCIITIQRQVCICSNCLTVLCGSCSQKHTCLEQHRKETEKRINKDEKSPSLKTERPSFQESQNTAYPCGWSDAVNLKTMPINCQRCRVKSAVKKCLNCCIKHYCLNCFKLVHNSQKMEKHENVELNSVENQEKKFIITNIVSQFQGKRVEHGKLSELNMNKISLARQEEQGEVKQQNKVFFKQIYEQIAKNSTFLTSLKVSIEEECKSIKKRSLQMMESVKQQLQQIIEETKLKIMEFDLKIAEKKKNNIEEYQEVMKDIQKTEIIFSQLVMMIENRPTVSNLWKDKITTKINKQIEAAMNMLQKQREIQQKNQKHQFSEYLADQSSAIKQKINKIDFKKMMLTQSPTKSSIMINLKSPKKSEKGHEGKKKSEFNSCKNSNISSCKSMDRIGPSSVILNSPQTKKSERKSSNNEQVLAKTVTSICFDSQQKLQESKDRNHLYSTYTISRNDNPEMKKPIRHLHEVKSKGVLLKTSRNSKNESLKNNLGYSGFNNCVNKAFANIQNTKKQLKDIRAEMNQFASRMMTEKNMRSSTEIQGDFQDEQLNISHISIDSLVYDGKK